MNAILCNESSPTCHEKCRKSSTNGDTYYYFCDFDGNKNFYLIQNSECFVKEKCGDYEKMVGTNECVLSCGSYYELGDFCFEAIPDNAEISNNDLNQLKCKYKYYITEVSGKKKFNCLGESEECPASFDSYNYDTGLCFTGPCSSLGNDIKMKIVNTANGNINRCSANCIGDEYLKTRVDSLGKVYSCVEGSACTLKNDGTEIKKCYDNENECFSDGYLYIKDGVCLKNCPDTYFKVKYSVDSQNRLISLGKCYEDENKCKEEGYTYYNNILKECWISCPYLINFDVDINQEISSDSNCVQSCSGTYQRKSGNYCKAKCINDEYYDQFSNNINECKSDCGNNYIKKVGNENTCVRIDNCPNSKFFINDSNKKQCISSSTDGCKGDNLYSIEGDNKCYKLCPKKADGKYYFYNDNKECISSCIGTSKEYAEDPTNEPKPCSDIDTNKYYYEEDKIFRDSCELYEGETSHICVKQCPQGYKVYDNYCIGNCPPDKPNFVESTMSILGENKNINRCILNCNQESTDYKYILKNNNQCLKGCLGDFYIVGNFCYNKCTNGKNFINPSDYQCKDSCDGYEFYEKLGNYQNIYICKSNAEGKLYFTTGTPGKELYSECPEGKNFIGKDNECKQECDSTDNEELYYELIKETPYKIYKCISSCSNPNKKNYIDKECIDGCPQDYHKVGDKCFLPCPVEKPYLNEESNECVDLCQGEKKYFIETEDQKKCLKDCTTLYPYFYVAQIDSKYYYKCKATCSVYIVNEDSNIIAKECLDPSTECPNTGAKFRYEIGNKIECYTVCPNGKYYIDDSYDSDEKLKCLDECPSGFYHEKNKYKCVKPEDCPKKTADYAAKTCVSECNTNYRTEIKDSEELIATICLRNCNDKYKYITPDNQCVENCDNSLYLVNDNSGKCLCQNLYYYDDSNIMICINPLAEACNDATNNDSPYKIKKYGSNECLKKCNGVLSVTETDCYDIPHVCSEENSQLITLSNGQKKCECKNKYRFENGIKKCLGPNNVCLNEEKYIPETNGCVNSCEAPYQYSFNNYCMSKCPERSSNIGDECNCPKYWYSYSNFNFVCLGENEECPKTHPFVIEETKQCVEKCTGTEILEENKCVSTCSDVNFSGTQIRSFDSNYKYANYICQCNHEWYYDINQKKIECESDQKECSEINPGFKYIVKETKQCVSSCPETDPFMFNSECLHNCESYSSQSQYYIKSVSNSKVCECIGLWQYEDDTKKTIKCITTGYCPYSSSEPYVEIVDTKECLKGDACPPEYPLKFNQKCYKMNKCPTNSHYDNTIQGTCVCDNSWYKYTDPNFSDIEFMFCLPKNKENCPMNNPNTDNNYPYQIFQTKECVKQRTNCPGNSYIFNYICYENSCPYATKESSDKNCICDKECGYWYKYRDNEIQRDYYKCALKKCEGNFINLYEKDKECVEKCYERNGEGGNPMFSFRGLCYEECPEFTKPKTDFQYECGFYKLEEAQNLEQLRNYVNIQVRELYQSSNVGGYLYNNSDISLQIYGLDKQNANKNLNMKSNLGYIDLDTCTEKIYQDNHLSDNDKILVIKYDMLNFKTKIKEDNVPQHGTGDNTPSGGNGDNTPSGGNGDNTPTGGNGDNTPSGGNGDNTPSGGTGDNTPSGGTGGNGRRRVSEPNADSGNNNENNNYLITPVEYEFFSSVTGDKIDASMCEPNEIIISYPISYTISKFDDFSEGMNKNDLRKKFEVGKILSHYNINIDVFNYNNSAYKTVCTGVEVNGKDLILEDRFETLYPNNISFCEPNCTYFSTDYELGRINCKCNYKKDLVFQREYPESGDLLNDPDFKNPTQSGSNLEVIKCLAKLPPVKNTIIKNEAFYYCTVITVAEVSMIFVAAFHGLKGAISSVSNLMKPTNKNININIETKNINKNNN